MSDIQLKMQRLRKMQERLVDEVKSIQQTCTHDNKEGKYKSNTGNWCRDDDSYWIDAHCLDCDKIWMIDSKDNKEEYRNFNGRKI